MTKDEYLEKATKDFAGLLQQMSRKDDTPMNMAIKINQFLSCIYDDAVKLEKEKE